MNMHAGRVLFFFLVLAGTPGVPSLLVAAMDAASQDDASGPRPAAPYRVLFSNDATNITSCVSPFNPGHRPFRGEFLDASVDETAGMGIDVHMLQPGLGWVPWWQSQVYPMSGHAAFAEAEQSSFSSWDKFVLRGGDVVERFIQRCRLRNLTPFISFRLNDAHHIFRNYQIEDPAERARAMAVCRFYHDHPELQLGPGAEKEGYDWYPYVLDWSHAEVRDDKFRLIEELCANYDFDGLELDFVRIPKYFRLDRTTAKQRAAILAGFVRRVRQALDDHTKPGSHRWLCVRIPPYLRTHGEIGIDLRAFAAAGVDMVNVAPHYFTVMTNDLAKMRKMLPDRVRLYHELHFAIALGPNDIVDGKPLRTLRRTTEQHFRTAAHLSYARGADGVSTFNFHYYRGAGDVPGQRQEPPFHVLKRLGDRRWLARQPQHYAWGRTMGRVLDSASRHAGRKLKTDFTPGETRGYDLDLAPPEGGWTTDGRLRIQAHAALDGTAWQASLNGVELEPTEDVSEPYENPFPTGLGKPADYRAWIVPRKVLRDGINRLELRMSDGPPSRVFYVDLAIR